MLDLLDWKDAAEAVKKLADLLGGRLVLSRRRLAAMKVGKATIRELETLFDLEE
jgi:hypothetical protein